MRAINRIVAAVVALLLLAVSVVAVVEIVLAAFGKSPWIVNHTAITNDLQQRVWRDGWVRLTGAGGIVLGLLLLYVALKPSTPTDLPLQSDDENVTVTVTRRSLETYVAGIAEAETGVDSASVKARKRRIGVSASTSLRDPGDLEQRVQQTVDSRLETLRLAKPVNAAVSIRNREK